MTSETDPISNIAIIRSNYFKFKSDECDEDSATPEGRDFAEFVSQILENKEGATSYDMVPGEGGWTFDVRLPTGKYRLFLHWASIGDPPLDHWIIQPDICKSLLRGLLGQQTRDEEIVPVVNALRPLLDNAEELKSVRWVSRSEFADLY